MNRPAHIKHIHDLRAQDFADHPVWRCAYNTDLEEPWYAADPADEATFRPWEGAMPFACHTPLAQAPLVAAGFTLADGTPLAGYCTPPWPGHARGDHLSWTQPAIFVGDEVVRFWLGAVPEESAMRIRQAAYATLNRASGDVFPIRYAIDARLIDERFEGGIEGFGRLTGPRSNDVLIEP